MVNFVSATMADLCPTRLCPQEVLIHISFGRGARTTTQGSGGTTLGGTSATPFVRRNSIVRLDAFGCDRTSAIVNGANEKTLIGRSAPLKLLFLRRMRGAKTLPKVVLLNCYVWLHFQLHIWSLTIIAYYIPTRNLT